MVNCAAEKGLIEDGRAAEESHYTANGGEQW